MTERTWWEKIETKGEEALEQLKRLIAEGNVRRVRIRQKDHVVAEFPLTFGVVGVVLAPVVAAIGAVAALMTDCTIEVERQEIGTGLFSTRTARAGTEVDQSTSVPTRAVSVEKSPVPRALPAPLRRGRRR